ncbi:MAG TPA: NnrS family protein [Devosia sp.]|nr:NnrS family protein [Devosia sp.]
MAQGKSGGVSRQPVPRGLARSGPTLFSYGFRPFFLAAGLWAMLAMGLWIAALVTGWTVGGSYGGAAWHSHEMLFGYSSAALAGFLLTAVPNWTGRLPVAGLPLAILFAVWCVGRLVLLAPDVLGLPLSLGIEAAFLPLLLAVCAREIVSGRKWKDLKILAVLSVLALANIGFHISVAGGGDIAMANRVAVSAYVVLVTIMGGRLIPSFTRNWLVKQKASALPASYSQFDTVAILSGVLALGLWVVLPATIWAAMACGAAALLHLLRLLRWRGWQTTAEKLVLILHIGYAFVPLGLAALAAAQLGLVEVAAAVHVLTVGVIGVMTLAIMTRATRGHTGLPMAASRITSTSYAALVGAAILRPLAGLWPDAAIELLSAAGACWILAFALYSLEYGPVLLTRRRDRTG